MKVLKATDPTKWTQQRTCERCKSELQVEFSDLTKISQRGDRPFEGDSFYFRFTCAVCHHSNTLPTKELPVAFHYAVKSPSDWQGR